MPQVLALLLVLGVMLLELIRSRHNERILRQQGATEPPGDVYIVMSWIYPLMFVCMAAEGAVARTHSWKTMLGGFGLFLASKLLKLWAMSTLGERWTYRVLVLPAVPLVSRGPYAHLRHPNYAAVFGEIAGFALVVGARITAVMSLLAFAVLVRKRIAIEENALGISNPEPRIPNPG